MTDQDFDMIRALLQERSAIVLDRDKQYLVETRLAPLVRTHDLRSISELVAELRTAPTGTLRQQIIEAMVTTESSFFRDHQPFEALRQVVIPDLLARRRAERRLTIWSAASSHGQEAYSVALLLREYFPELATWNITLLASDLSRDVLTRAREGRYNQTEVSRGLPTPLLTKYFDPCGAEWQLKPALRAMVDFQEINIAQPLPSLPRMDLIMLRNVMIYFDVATKTAILGRLARVLKPDGYLLLGGAETTLNLHDAYRRVELLKAGFYQLVAPGRA